MKNRINPDQLSLFERHRLESPQLSDDEIVREISEHLLDETAVTPPVNVELMASMRGIVRIEQHVQAYAGMLAPGPSGMVAHVRAGDCQERQRFTVLHETGHTLLPGFTESRHFRCAGPRVWEERMCDTTAGELLLPRRYFVADLRRTGLTMAGVGSLAKTYEASVEATAVRSVDLSPSDALLLAFNVRHKPSEAGMETDLPPKLRLDWSYGKGQWPFLRRHKSVDEGSAFARAHEGELVEETGELGSLTADDVGPVRISARRYGAQGRVVALVSRLVLGGDI